MEPMILRTALHARTSDRHKRSKERSTATDSLADSLVVPYSNMKLHW